MPVSLSAARIFKPPFFATNQEQLTIISCLVWLHLRQGPGWLEEDQGPEQGPLEALRRDAALGGPVLGHSLAKGTGGWKEGGAA